MKLELEHTIIDGVERYSIWLNGTILHKSCKTQDEAMKYYNECGKAKSIDYQLYNFTLVKFDKKGCEIIVE